MFLEETGSTLPRRGVGTVGASAATMGLSSMAATAAAAAASAGLACGGALEARLPYTDPSNGNVFRRWHTKEKSGESWNERLGGETLGELWGNTEGTLGEQRV